MTMPFGLVRMDNGELAFQCSKHSIWEISFRCRDFGAPL